MRTTTLLALLIPAASYSWINIQDDTTKPDTVAECAEPARRNDAVTIDPEVTGPVAETDPTTPSLRRFPQHRERPEWDKAPERTA